jgi:Protein of unknown function, DUF481
MLARQSQFVLLALAVLSLSGALRAQDVIHFQNGDRLTGTIKRLERGQVVFSSPLMDGDASIDWRGVARIESERTFQFQTSSGERFLGRIEMDASPEAAEDEVRIASPQGDRFVRQDEIVLATQTVKGLSGLLEINLGAGIALSKSNSQKQFNADSGITYQTPRYLATAAVSSIFSTQEEATSTNRHELDLGFSRKLSRNWSTSLLANFLTSEEQKLDLRIVLGGGPTRTFVNNNRVVLYATGGAVWNSERFSPESGNVPVNNQLEGLAAVGFNYFQFKQWTVESTFRLFPSITTGGRVRADWRTNLRLRVRKGKPLWWNFNQTINLDNRPPGDAPGTDYVTSSALSWSFP